MQKNEFITNFLKETITPSTRELMEFLFSYAFPDDNGKKASEYVCKLLFAKGGLLKDDVNIPFPETFTAEQEAFLKGFISLLKTSHKLISEGKCFSSHSTAGEFIKNFIGNNASEGLYMICLTEQNYIISAQKITDGDLGSIFIDVNQIINKAMESEAKKVVIAHNHTSVYMRYSIEDYYATEKLSAYFKRNGITLMEHFAVNPYEYHGILKDLNGTDNWKS